MRQLGGKYPSTRLWETQIIYSQLVSPQSGVDGDAAGLHAATLRTSSVTRWFMVEQTPAYRL